jgi:hypothetical protein
MMHDRLRDAVRQFTVDPAEDRFDNEGGYMPGSHEDIDRLMAKYSVHRVAGQYGFRGFRYDRLADAIAYARQVGAHPDKNQEALTLSVAAPREQAAASEADSVVMATLHIEFKDGRYHFRGYRYDRLVDAVRYARSMATNTSSSQVLLA